MSDLILDQFSRLLAGLPPEDPWRELENSGFLDLLRPEAEGGAELSLEDLFPLVIEAGRWRNADGVIETMAARLVMPDAVQVPDVERALREAGRPEIARPLAAALASGLMAGIMGRLVEMTVTYAGERRQFGREIGKFQAIQQQIALMAEEAIAARMAAQGAFVGLPLDIEPRRAAAAKARAGQAAGTVASIAHAVHGAIGVSAEHTLHRHTGRLRELAMAHGGETAWTRRLGSWVLSQDAGLIELARKL